MNTDPKIKTDFYWCTVKGLLEETAACQRCLFVMWLLFVAVAILDGRQKRAEELRRLTDQSGSMSEDQLSELRADIKVAHIAPPHVLSSQCIVSAFATLRSLLVVHSTLLASASTMRIWAKL